MTLQRHQIGAQRAAAVRHSNPWTTQRNERETLGYRGNCYCHVQDEAVELDIVLYYVKMTEQTGLKQVPVCLEHSSCVEPTGGRDDTATGLPQAKKIWETLAPGHNHAVIFSAAWHRHLAGGRSCQARKHPWCMHASCRHAFSSTVSSVVINISTMHHAGSGSGSGETSIVDHAVAHIAGCRVAHKSLGVSDEPNQARS